MEHFRRVIAALGLLVAFPSVAQQDEGAVYFSLSSGKTFGPGEKPVVQLWGQGISELQFRVYRVNDAVKFFEKLEEPHRFGGQAPRREGELTPLERWRSWKRQWRARVQRLGRAQFSYAARVRVREWRQEREAKTAPPATGPVRQYAEVPLLNPQQLVASWEQPYRSGRRWESATIPIPVKDRGLYLVEATSGKLHAYTIVSVTSLGLITKTAPGRLLVRAVNRETGEPIPNVAVTLVGGGAQKRNAESRTDGNGMVEFGAPEEARESLQVVARRDRDVAIVSAYGEALRPDPDRDVTGYVYTERPVYRPGHTVHYKAMLRSRRSDGYAVPAGREASVEIQDDEGKAVHRYTGKLSAMGTLHGSFVVPAAASLGYYSVQVKMGESYSHGGFQVEEYRKPEYEVRVKPEPRRVVQGQAVSVQVEARYFYGEPVAAGKVSWVVHRSRYWVPWGLGEEEDEGMEESDSPYARREQILEGEGVLDGDGRLTISVPTQAAPIDQQYRIEARVTDAGGREIAGSATAVATVGSFFVTATPERYYYSPQEKAAIRVETRDYDGKPVRGVAFRVELREWRWREEQTPLVSQTQGTTDAQGSAVVELPVKSGSLRAKVTARTAEGREVSDTAYVWVSGESDTWERGPQRIQIVPEKKSYRPGETAKALIVAGRPGAHLWVTVEGRGVWRSEYLTARDGTATIEVPIEARYVPNVFISAVAMVDNKLLNGTQSVRVPPTEKVMQVELKPAKSEYKPGEPAAYTLEAKDHQSRPVAAEFSVGVVDEAVYAVRPESVPDIARVFYGREWNRVGTDSSLSYYFSGEAGKRRMQLAEVRPWRPRAQLKPEGLIQPKVRKAFPDTAFWVAEARTDAQGRATVRFEFPDALTTWRATARGITQDTKVGSAVNRVIVRKNLLTRLAVPRFFRQGDTMTVTVIAQNFLAEAKRVRMSLEAKGLEILEGGTRDVEIASRGTGTVDYRVRVPVGREAVLTAKALTDVESDAMEMTLPVVPYGVRITQSKSGTLDAARSEQSAAVEFPADAEPGTRRLEIEVTPSAAAALFSALEYLTTFPYGCTEQTMSSFLPNVVVAQAVEGLKLKGRVDQAALARKVRAGLERLEDYQHEDGGWGWWKTDDSEPFMTAYVVAGLAQAKGAGYPVNPESLNRGAEWLSEALKSRRVSLETRAYAAYALALAKAKPALDEIWGQRGRLSSQALATVGLALAEAGDPRAGEAAEMLEGRARTSGTEAWWEAPRDELLDIAQESSVEATAFALKLLARQKPQSPLLSKAALYLVNHRNQGYYWNSTKQTAMAVYGLTDYVRVTGELSPTTRSAAIYVNGQQVASRRFEPAQAAETLTFTVDDGKLTSGANQVRVLRGEGSGYLYWSARAVHYSQAGGLAQRGNLQLGIAREYFRLEAQKEGDRTVYDLKPLQGTVKQGDVLAVRLSVSGGDWRYLLVEDPIPAGTEIIGRDDLYEIRQKPPWWKYGFSRREERDDRAVFFQTFFSRGSAEYFHLLKVINPGQFRVSPARVEPMYQPQWFATSQAQTLEVER